MHLNRRKIEKIVEPVGCTVIDVVNGGKHAKVTLDYHGARLMTVFPWTPSDGRFEDNKRSDIRKHLKQTLVWRA